MAGNPPLFFVIPQALSENKLWTTHITYKLTSRLFFSNIPCCRYISNKKIDIALVNNLPDKFSKNLAS